MWLDHGVNRLLRRRPKVIFYQGDQMSGRFRAVEVSRALRRRGWASVVVPPQLEQDQRERLAARISPDIAVLQQCRHPLNDADVIPRAAHVVLDIDDADWLDIEQAPRLERIVKHVDLVAAGNRNTKLWAESLGTPAEVVWTSSSPPRLLRRRRRGEPPVVTWASSDANRLHEERRFVARVVERVDPTLPYRLWIFGVSDPGEVLADFNAVAAAGVEITCFAPLPYRRFLAKLAEASIGLNPLQESLNPYAAGKSFGKTLAYLTSGLAVVTTATVDHPLFFEHGRNGMMCAGEDEWVGAIDGLLRDPQTRRRIAAAGEADYRRRLTPAAAAAVLDANFRVLLAAGADQK